MDQNLDNKSQRDKKEKIGYFVSSVIQICTGKKLHLIINHSYIKSKVLLIDLNRHVRLDFDETRVGPRTDCRFRRKSSPKIWLHVLGYENQDKLLRFHYLFVVEDSSTRSIFFRVLWSKSMGFPTKLSVRFWLTS